MQRVPYEMWVSYYLLLLATVDAHPKHVLDVACGTGTMSHLLHREGITVTGLDISAEMIFAAKEKARQQELELEYFVADARDFNLGREFPGAYSVFDSLNNITEPSELGAAFGCISRHLPSGGTFIFDLNTPYAFEKEMFNQSDMRPRTKLKYEWHGEYDRTSRIIQVDMQFWYDDAYFRELHVQRAYVPSEVLPLLAQSGFRDVRTYHSYTIEPPRKNSDRIHYVAIRD
jgi:SAM-dependent methyltransferase